MPWFTRNRSAATPAKIVPRARVESAHLSSEPSMLALAQECLAAAGPEHPATPLDVLTGIYTYATAQVRQAFTALRQPQDGDGFEALYSLPGFTEQMLWDYLTGDPGSPSTTTSPNSSHPNPSATPSSGASGPATTPEPIQTRQAIRGGAGGTPMTALRGTRRAVPAGPTISCPGESLPRPHGQSEEGRRDGRADDTLLRGAPVRGGFRPVCGHSQD